MTVTCLPFVGQTVRITSVKGESVGLKWGQLVRVGACRREHDSDGYTWITTGNALYPQQCQSYGWVKWEAIREDPEPDLTAPTIGQWIRITRDFNTHGLKPGDVIRVGCVAMNKTGDAPTVVAQYPGAVWVTTGDDQQGQEREKYGWVTWEAAEQPLQRFGCLRDPVTGESVMNRRTRVGADVEAEFFIQSDPTVPHGYPCWKDYAHALEHEREALERRLNEDTDEGMTEPPQGYETWLEYYQAQAKRREPDERMQAALDENEQLREKLTAQRRELRNVNRAIRVAKLETESWRGQLQELPKVRRALEHARWYYDPSQPLGDECARIVGELVQEVNNAPEQRQLNEANIALRESREEVQRLKARVACLEAPPGISRTDPKLLADAIKARTQPFGPPACYICSRPDCDNPNGKH